MQDHHGPAKETDITAVLVVALVLMVGVLIAKTATQFTQVKTSTNSKAAGIKLKPMKNVKKGVNKDVLTYVLTGWDKACIAKLTEKFDKYSIWNAKAGDVYFRLGSGCIKDTEVLFYDGYVTNTETNTKDSGKCCATKSYMFTANDKYCSNSSTGNLDLRCKVTCSTAYGNDTANTYTQELTGGKCDKITGSSGNLMELIIGISKNKAVCCMDPV